MSRVYEALRKIGESDPGHASKAERPHPTTVEVDETTWSGSARPLETRRLGAGTLQWPPPEPADEGTPVDGGSSGDGSGQDSTRRIAAASPRALSFSELIQAIARDEQDLGS